MNKLIFLNRPKLCFILVLSFFCLGSIHAQDQKSTVDTSSISRSLIKIGNNKCDSAKVRLKNRDKKGANKLYSEAIKDYKKALKTTPDSYEANYRLGIAQTKTENYKAAIISFDKALSLDPEKGDAFRERGVAWVGLKLDSLAIKDFNKAIDLNYDDYEAYMQRAYIKEKIEIPIWL